MRLARCDVTRSWIIHSTVTLVLPYGFVGPSGHSSGMGIMLGKRVASPYTVADDENTMFVTSCAFMLYSRFSVPATFTW